MVVCVVFGGGTFVSNVLSYLLGVDGNEILVRMKPYYGIGASWYKVDAFEGHLFE